MIQKPDRHVLKSNRTYASTKDDLNRPVIISLGVTLEGFGILTCDCDHYVRKNWCKHIMFVYGDESMNRKLPDEEAMMVDLFLKRPLLVPVVVSPPENDNATDTFAIHVLWGDVKQVAGEFHSEGGEVIAFLKEPTRKRVRHEILEWLPSKVYDVDRCTSSSHMDGDSILDGLQYPENWDQMNEESKRDYLRDVFCLLDEKRCAKCAEMALVPF